MSSPKLILASASPRRFELLRQLGVSFTVVPSRAEELHDSALSVRQLCETNARRKAEEVAGRYPDAIILGADTLVAKGSRIFGKPKDLADARRMLTELSGTEHKVVTAVCLVNKADRKEDLFADVTRVTFRPVTREQIENYMELVHVLDKAGAYAIQEHGDLIIEKIDGSHSNVVGLPLEELQKRLSRFGL